MNKSRNPIDYATGVMSRGLALQLTDYLTNFEPDRVPLVNRAILVRPIIDIYLAVGIPAASDSYHETRALKAIREIDFLQEGWRNEIRRYAENYAYRISNELTETTKRTIQRTIEEGKELKLNNTQLKDLILSRVTEINDARARNIARTESTTAGNFGKRIGAVTYFKESGQKGYKYWVHGKSKDPRHTHLQLVKNDPIPVDEMFMVGGEPMENPGDVNASARNRCNCTCTCNYISEAVYIRRFGGSATPAPAPIIKPPRAPRKPRAVRMPVQADPGEYVPVKNLYEAQKRAAEYFTERLGYNVDTRDMQISDEMTLDRMNVYLRQLDKLTAKYNVYEEKGQVAVLFESTEKSFGYLRPRNYGGVDQINFGHRTSVWGMDRDRNSGLGVYRSKSAIDEANADIATLTHEFAHLISIDRHQALALNNPRAFNAFWKKLNEYRRAYHTELLNSSHNEREIISLGQYASSNSNEFMAEAFTEYQLHSAPSKYAQLVGELIDKYFKK